VSRPITRREALAEMLAGTAAVALAGCGGSGAPSGSGSTLTSTWRDVHGVGVLAPGPGEPLIARTELGTRRPGARVLTTLVHVTDSHVLDASSPARVTFLDRLGTPFQSTFRPHETLTAHVLDGAVKALRRLRPDLVIEGGDLIDNAQANELVQALSVLRGGTVRPGSGPHGYFGVQLARNPDPFYYRPDLDAPRHPGLLREAVRPLRSVGVGSRWCPVLGDHDMLVAGEIPPDAQTQALALGNEAVWELPSGLSKPRGSFADSADGPPDPQLVSFLLARAQASAKVRVPPDRRRREMDVSEVVSGLRGASGVVGSAQALDYHLDVGERLRLIVLDLARRGGGSGGLVRPGHPSWLAAALAAAGERWVIVVSHQPLESSEGGEALLALLDQHPRVIAALCGHTHRNRIDPRDVAPGGYWLISTASLIDHPQQARALRVIETEGGGVAIQTWMIDHIGSPLADVSRELAYLDAQGGRPQGFAGRRLDRNATLYRARV
jgi:3',5'-cyclic AMP phosphodiesterase CpdA